MPRWLPLATAGLLAIVVVIGIGLWKFDSLRTARVENGGLPAVPACSPDNSVGKALLPNCPDPSTTPAKVP